VKASQVMGLHVAGVDLLESKEGPKVIEINSSPGFEGLESATGKDIARDILEYTIAYAESRRRPRKPVNP
jgi:ribosomal protein S6--L-glutamate ligase